MKWKQIEKNIKTTKEEIKIKKNEFKSHFGQPARNIVNLADVNRHGHIETWRKSCRRWNWMMQRRQEIDCRHSQDYKSRIRWAEYYSSQEAGILRRGKEIDRQPSDIGLDELDTNVQAYGYFVGYLDCSRMQVCREPGGGRDGNPHKGRKYGSDSDIDVRGTTWNHM